MRHVVLIPWDIMVPLIRILVTISLINGDPICTYIYIYIYIYIYMTTLGLTHKLKSYVDFSIDSILSHDWKSMQYSSLVNHDTTQ